MVREGSPDRCYAKGGGGQVSVKGRGMAYGAASIINAMPSGFGAAFSVGLKTTAEVEITKGEVVKVEIKGDPGEDKRLAIESFKVVMERFGLKKGGLITTESEIPIAIGMKSSSAAANAIVLATLDALGERVPELEAVKMGVEASVSAGVTLTGAFDDACASLLGGLHVTDNYGRQILKSFEMEPLSVIFLAPEGKRYSGKVDAALMKTYARTTLLALEDALAGRYWQAMLLNGLVMAHAFGVNPAPILTAMKKGALSAGLCGKGPSICAVSKKEQEGDILDAWADLGLEMIRTQINSNHGRQGA
jgi:shikimate kinase